MDKRQLIDDIRRLNATATTRFLAQFDADALRQYLDHLAEARARNEQVEQRLAPVRRVAAERVLV